jgi:hypothetical protein
VPQAAPAPQGVRNAPQAQTKPAARGDVEKPTVQR